jgi:hypothetical protein
VVLLGVDLAFPAPVLVSDNVKALTLDVDLSRIEKLFPGRKLASEKKPWPSHLLLFPKCSVPLFLCQLPLEAYFFSHELNVMLSCD